MSRSRQVVALTLFSALGAGCHDDIDESLSSYRAQLRNTNGVQINGIQINGIQINGIQINGIQINGIQINGIQINGIQINGIQINGIQINGIQINGFKLDGGKISYVLPTGQTLSGTDLKGMILQVSIPDPGKTTFTKYSFRLDDVSLDTANPFKDVWLYQVSYKVDGAQNWTSPCVDYSGQPAPIIPIKGMYWDETTGKRVDDSSVVYLACREGAVGKCVSAGYRPWATGTVCADPRRQKYCRTVALKDYHQACTRLIRADYCGDGTPHTVNGTVLDVFDYLTPPVQLQEETWQMEARWNQNGALCLSKQRHPEIPFPGCLRQLDPKKPASYVPLPKCQPYALGDDRGLVVSTFNSMSVLPGK